MKQHPLVQANNKILNHNNPPGSHLVWVLGRWNCWEWAQPQGFTLLSETFSDFLPTTLGCFGHPLDVECSPGLWHTQAAALPAARRQGWLSCQAAFISVGYCYPPKSGSREIFLVRNLSPILGVLRCKRFPTWFERTRGQREGEKESADAGRGLSWRLGCRKQGRVWRGELGLSHGERHWFLEALGTNQVWKLRLRATRCCITSDVICFHY